MPRQLSEREKQERLQYAIPHIAIMFLVTVVAIVAASFVTDSFLYWSIIIVTAVFLVAFTHAMLKGGETRFGKR
jgi:membrane protein YdbS with pleckstrin-like domain